MLFKYKVGILLDLVVVVIIIGEYFVYLLCFLVILVVVQQVLLTKYHSYMSSTITGTPMVVFGYSYKSTKGSIYPQPLCGIYGLEIGLNGANDTIGSLNIISYLSL